MYPSTTQNSFLASYGNTLFKMIYIFLNTYFGEFFLSVHVKQSYTRLVTYMVDYLTVALLLGQ